LILLWNSRRVGVADYDQFLVFDELQYWNANLFGASKQWAPVLCGGVSIAAEPQVPFASLSMLLSYVLGPLPGIVAAILIYLGLGWIGAYLYSGLWLTESRQRSLAASLFIGNGFFICRLAHGHIDFIPFLVLPLALWMIHGPTRLLQLLLLGMLLSVSIDGSPAAIIHLVVWIALYTIVLSWVRRSITPTLFLAAACAVAAVLDAGYLWPMLNAQGDFPRRTADTFTGPWALVWFLLLPHRGKVLPSNGTGIELSVFIGPFLAILVWRYRELLRRIPDDMRVPLLAVSIASICLGMGSLHSMGLPVWLSPFDWLRPLPGFRSIGVTGRYWGFLALPLSLAAAMAISKYMKDAPEGPRKTLFLGAALLTQLVFQAQSVSSGWSHSRAYTPAPLQGIYSGAPQQIERVLLQTTGRRRHRHHQGELISPTRAVINCYDMDDFKRAPVDPGTDLIKEVEFFDSGVETPPTLQASFITWNHIRVTPLPQTGTAIAEFRITFNQAFNRGWTSPMCEIDNRQDNLTARCPASALAGPIELTFFDPVSALGARVSVAAWCALPIGLATLALMAAWTRRRSMREA
jgi:hypothetical protein